MPFYPCKSLPYLSSYHLIPLSIVPRHLGQHASAPPQEAYIDRLAGARCPREELPWQPQAHVRGDTFDIEYAADGERG